MFIDATVLVPEDLKEYNQLIRNKILQIQALKDELLVFGLLIEDLKDKRSG